MRRDNSRAAAPIVTNDVPARVALPSPADEGALAELIGDLMSARFDAPSAIAFYLIYVSGIVQYNSTNASVGSNLRFRWEYRPGSELFVVYTDDYDTEAKAGVDALRNRAFVVKVNRLFRP
mgnify:CR=1 FL=1